MADLDEELWKLGVNAKTEHNEVAPCQHEMAPVFATANIATDHNQLTMEIMKKVADRHGLVCLLHEKAVRGRERIGQAQQLVDFHRQGRKPARPGLYADGERAVPAVPDSGHQGRGRVSGFAAHQRCQRGQRPPPGARTRRRPPSSPCMSATSWPPSSSRWWRARITRRRGTRHGYRRDEPAAYPQDNSDATARRPSRSRATSLNSHARFVLQHRLHERHAQHRRCRTRLMQFADELEKADDFETALSKLIRRELAAHRRILFNGNGYREEWRARPSAAGCSTCAHAGGAHPLYGWKNVALFARHGVYTQTEIQSAGYQHGGIRQDHPSGRDPDWTCSASRRSGLRGVLSSWRRAWRPRRASAWMRPRRPRRLDC